MDDVFGMLLAAVFGLILSDFLIFIADMITFRGDVNISFDQFRNCYLTAPEKYKLENYGIWYYPGNGHKRISIGFNPGLSSRFYHRFKRNVDKELKRMEDSNKLKTYLQFVQQDIEKELQKSDNCAKKAKETILNASKS